MGTRSLIVIEDGGKELITLYRHWDGYPSAAGRAILDALKGCTVVNGSTLDAPETEFNGIGRLAVSLICDLKDDIRIQPAGTREVGEEYVYLIYLTETDQFQSGIGKPMLKVFSGPMTAFGFGGEKCDNVIYDGPLDDFDPDMEENEDAA